MIPPPAMQTAMKPTFMQWARALPLVTMCTIALLWLIHVFRLITGQIPTSEYSLAHPLHVPAEAYRVFTGALLHADGLHVTLNTLALSSIGPKLESAFGSVAFLYLQVMCTVLCSLAFVGILAVSSFVAVDDGKWTMQQTVGYSGCLFALFVIEAELTEADPPLVLFGRFALPKRLMPWAMLLFIQILIPNASFMGHLSGALVGFALCRGAGKVLMSCCCKWQTLDARCGGNAPSFRNAFSTGQNPFEKTEQNPLLCCGQTSAAPPLLPTTVAFPTTGGRRLGST